jgi:hypothetical protein
MATFKVEESKDNQVQKNNNSTPKQQTSDGLSVNKKFQTKMSGMTHDNASNVSASFCGGSSNGFKDSASIGPSEMWSIEGATIRGLKFVSKYRKRDSASGGSHTRNSQLNLPGLSGPQARS